MNDGEFVDHEIRKHLIDTKENRRLDSIYLNGMGINTTKSQVVECRLSDSDKGSERMESAYGFKHVLEKINKKPKNKEPTSLKVNIDGKCVEVKTSNMHHLVKRFARSIFKKYDLNPERGRLSADSFEKWILEHK